MKKQVPLWFVTYERRYPGIWGSEYWFTIYRTNGTWQVYDTSDRAIARYLFSWLRDNAKRVQVDLYSVNFVFRNRYEERGKIADL